MALSRNARRAIAKARAAEKLARIAKASLAHERDQREAIVKANLSRPRPERNYYPQSSLAGISGQSHRGYVCRNALRELPNSQVPKHWR